MITSFRGPWTRLSNYAICSVWYGGHIYPSTEHAYQAAKFGNEDYQQQIRNAATPNVAKKIARSLEVAGYRRKDWDEVKIGIMRELLAEKFSQEAEKLVLLATGDEELVEGNWWGDRFWGQCPVGTGENWLGKLLMELRAELRKEQTKE